MTTRRPPGTNFETAVERELREAIERGEFDRLAGRGHPLTELDDTDELWWVKRKLKDEGFVQLPPSLALRRDAHEARDRARHAASPAEVRAILEPINERLERAVRIPLSGPSIYVPPYDIDRAVARWHEDHPTPPPPEPTEAPDPASTPRPRRWRRRRSGR